MYSVFEKRDSTYYQKISIPFATTNEAKDFVSVMKEGVYYSSIHPEYRLVIIEELGEY